ncbi:hypothetical protein GCM10027053_51660 [Intrasporangium mesophilum]
MTVTVPDVWAPERTIPDLEAVLEHAILNTDRSLQRTIGPSSLGSECDRCLILELAGMKAPEETAPWLPTIGTAVHEWAEGAVIKWLAATGSDRYIPEARVMVGVVDGTEIWGSSDLFDTWTGTVVDYKVVGTTSLRSTRKNGARLTYRRQAQLYGKGMEDKGYQVQSVAIWMLPRNGFTIGAGHLHQEPYDRAMAEAVIAHADMLAAAIRTLGVEAVLAATGPHAGTEFSCPAPDKGPVTAEAFLLG